MIEEKVEKQRFRVSVHLAKSATGAIQFTFVPKERQHQHGTTGAPKHTVQVSGHPDKLAFDWSASPDAPEAVQAELEQIVRDRLAALDAWLHRVNDLVGCIEQWGKDLGWATRRIEKRLEDSGVGTHTVPALLLQEDTVRVLLEPVSRLVPGAEGVVDLYLMPAYDDIASLFFRQDQWLVHYILPGMKASAPDVEAQPKPLSKETLAQILQEMKKHAQ